MTLLTTAMRQEYVADGSNKVFIIPWKYYSASDIKVKTRPADGETETQCSDISVSGSSVTAPATASVAAFVAGVVVIVERWVGMTQGDDYTNQGSFFPEDIEKSLDRAYMALQQMDYQVGIFWSNYNQLKTYVAAAQEAKLTAVASKEAAAQSASAAALSQSEANLSATSANLSAQRALESKNNAVSAKDAAETAQAASESASASAESAISTIQNIIENYHYEEGEPA